MGFPLPPELLLRILEFLLERRPRSPIPLLLVNSEFNSLCLSVLHTVLYFLSIRQLDCFVRTCRKLIFRPRALLITLPGGTADFRLFKLLHDLLLHIDSISPREMLESENNKCSLSVQREVGLRRIQLCLNSHMFDENCKYLSKALGLTDPEEFTWTGPDPAHHFSIAIVPTAASYLFRAVRTWTNLRHLKLTNLAYPHAGEGSPPHPLAEALGLSDCMIRHSAGYDHTDTLTRPKTASSSMPYLQSIYLGQITFLDPSEIARIACTTELVFLTSIRVVDAYQGSIWGPRVRKADVERAASILLSVSAQAMDDTFQISQKVHMERVKTLVSCEALTERIMGGDRMDYDN